MIKRRKLSEFTVDYHTRLIEELKDPKLATAYLQVAIDEYLEDGNKKFLLLALRNLAEAHGGITTIAKKTKLSRQSLYKTLSARGNPRLDTLGLLIKALGFHLSVEAVQ